MNHLEWWCHRTYRISHMKCWDKASWMGSKQLKDNGQVKENVGESDGKVGPSLNLIVEIYLQPMYNTWLWATPFSIGFIGLIGGLSNYVHLDLFECSCLVFEELVLERNNEIFNEEKSFNRFLWCSYIFLLLEEPFWLLYSYMARGFDLLPSFLISYYFLNCFTPFLVRLPLWSYNFLLEIKGANFLLTWWILKIIYASYWFACL